MRARHQLVPSGEHALVGAYVRQARLAAGLSQKELSDALGMPQSYVSKIERGERHLQLVEWVLVCRVLKADPAEALGDFLSSLPVLSTLAGPARVRRRTDHTPRRTEGLRMSEDERSARMSEE